MARRYRVELTEAQMRFFLTACSYANPDYPAEIRMAERVIAILKAALHGEPGRRALEGDDGR